MYKTLEDYKKEKEFLIAFDSDGCVMDNMTVKHQNFFFPLVLDTFGLDDSNNDLARIWDEINLEYPSRGINRFLGLGKFLKKVDAKDAELYYQWLESSEVLSNDVLAREILNTNDLVMKKVLEWSIAVNKKIKNELDIVLPFEYSIEAIKEAAQVADIVVMSSANREAIENEWSKAGILKYVKFVASQEIGTKKDCLRALIDKGYSSPKVLMVGDARGDYEAANALDVHYYQITYRKEVSSWKDFRRIALDRLLSNNYSW